MKRSFRMLSVLLLGAVMTAVIACLSACSLLVSYIEEENSENGSSGSVTSETYTLDVTVYDIEWYASVVDATSWTTTANVDAYAYDELTLYSDGTYELIKTMGAGDEAVSRWGSSSDKHFVWYAYYGTYTQSGNDVTLSECTSIGVEVDVFEMMLAYSLGNYVIAKTTTTDLTQGAGCCGDETVVDLMYGALIVDSGYGNCSQIVTLGTYDYGTFTFSGLASSGDSGDDGGDGGDGTETITIPDGGYTFTSGTNSDIIFNIYADGSYVFAWETYSVMESGTYTWDRLTQTLTIYDPTGTSLTADVSGDEISFTYYYSASSALLQDYTGSVEEMEDVICEVVYEFIPITSADVTLRLYSDETYTYADSANGVRESGTYDYSSSDNALTLTLPDDSQIVSTYEGNLLKITYVACADGTSTQDFVGSVAVADETLPSEIIYTFTSGVNDAITFKLKNDGTYEFAWAANGVTETGTWSYVGGVFSVTDPLGTKTEATISGDAISFTYYYSLSSYLYQPYTGSVSELISSMISNEVITEVYSFTAGTNSAITFKLLSNGMYEFAWEVNGVTEYGVWTLENGALTITDPLGTQTVATISGDNISFTYYYSITSQLNQDYTGSLSELVSSMIESGMITEVYSFTAGTNSAITFKLYSNGMYEFAWEANGVTEYGVWTLENGALTITDPLGTQTVATISGDNISFTYYYSLTSQLNQDYTGSLSELVSSMIESSMITEVYSFTAGTNSAITFKLYSNGMYEFAWEANGVTEYGIWSFDGGQLTITDPLGTQTVATISGDDISFTYYYSITSQLNQDYTGSFADLWAAALDSGFVTEVYSFTASTNDEITFTLYRNGMYEFAWAANSVAEYGTWSLEGGVFTITDPLGKQTTVNISGDSISFVYYYSLSEYLYQAYTGSLADLFAAATDSGAINEVYSFTAGTNSAITFTLYSNGMYEFAWAANGVSELGTWSYADGALTITDPLGTQTAVTISGDEISFTYYYSLTSQLNQDYTGSLSELESAIGD